MGLLTESFKEKLQSSLLSSDPRMSHIRQGMLEKLGPMAGKRPVAPTFGELAASLVSGKRQGEKDFLTSEMQKFQLEQIKAPNQQVVGDGKGGYKLVTIGKPVLLEDGTYSTPEIDIQQISEGITPTTLMVGVDDIEIKERIPGIDLTKENEGTTITFDREKYKIDRKKVDKPALFYQQLEDFIKLSEKGIDGSGVTREDMKFKILRGVLQRSETVNSQLLPIAKKIVDPKVGWDGLTTHEKKAWTEIRRVPWLEALMKNDIIAEAIGATGGTEEIVTITTQEGYDKLPSGSQYYDGDGNLATKR